MLQIAEESVRLLRAPSWNLTSKAPFVSEVNWEPLRKILEENDSFLITTHVRPDGDALGSQRGLAAILESLGKQVAMVNATAPPANLLFMNTDERVKRLGEGISRNNVPATDVSIIVDTSAWQQLGDMTEVLRNGSAKRLVIDHHVSSDDLQATEFKDTQVAATGQLICELADFLGVTLGADAASWLYVAMATDTGWYRFPSTSAETMRAAAAMIDCGARPDDLYCKIHEQRSLARVHLSGRVLQRLQLECDGRLAWISANHRDLAETHAVPADTEGLVNQCLTVAGAEAAFIAVELPTNQVKCSLRCRPPHDVAAVAETMGGGGHRLASGVTLSGDFDQAVNRIRQAFHQMLEL